MEETAISLQNVSKKFRLFNSPQERLLEALHPFNKKYHKEFWALKDINFEVKKGVTFGIIGRNGAGKSTLLQIICSILRPTFGTVTVRGRISALLALGAGFNPEFTGRQNVLMNGTLMGFSSEEMKKRLPEIEAFADIGEFIDQPMKIYSSGMSLRLAFAAAINVDPDILVVDEALAVGDAKFQYKCYQKFIEFQKANKTIILVTHDMNAIVRHCNQAILLENSSIAYIGLPKEVVHAYHEFILSGGFSEGKDSKNLSPLPEENINNSIHILSSPEVSSKDHVIDEFILKTPQNESYSQRKSYNRNEYRFGDKRGEIIDYFIVSNGAKDITEIFSGDTIDIYIKARFYDSIESPLYGFAIKTIDGVYIYGSNTKFYNTQVCAVEKGNVVVLRFSILMSLAPGNFFIDLGLAERSGDRDVPLDIREGVIHLYVIERKHFDGLAELKTRCEEIMIYKTVPHG
jgi:lipopolysaccharide transport system ATP-binding protein